MTIAEYLENHDKKNTLSSNQAELSDGNVSLISDENQIVEEYEGICEKCEQESREKACPVCG